MTNREWILEQIKEIENKHESELKTIDLEQLRYFAAHLEIEAKNDTN